MKRIPQGIYTLDFRAEAVKIVEHEGLSVERVAKRLSRLALSTSHGHAREDARLEVEIKAAH